LTKHLLLRWMSVCLLHPPLAGKARDKTRPCPNLPLGTDKTPGININNENKQQQQPYLVICNAPRTGRRWLFVEWQKSMWRLLVLTERGNFQSPTLRS